MQSFSNAFTQYPSLTAGIELMLMLVTDPRTMILFALLAIAAVTDIRTYRIPNWLTVGGIAIALVYSAVDATFPHPAFLSALGGAAIGLVVMVPAYALRVMGAGDVKLMAMTGAFLGASDILSAIVATFIVGGVAAFAFALYHRALRKMLVNVKTITETIALSAASGTTAGMQVQPARSIGKLPYGACIAIGSAGYVIARHFGYF